MVGATINPLNIYHFLTDPINYMTQLKNKFGDPYPLAFPGAPTIWLTANPELVKSIFTAPFDSFCASENNPVGPLLGPEGLIMLSGTEHQKTRKEFAPNFTKKILMTQSQSIKDSFTKIFYQYEPSGVLHLQQFSEQATLQIILKILFPDLSPKEEIEAVQLTEKFLKSYSASYLFIPKWVPGTWGNFNEKKLALDCRFYQFFLETMDSEKASPLKVLKNASKEAVLDHIRTFIVAGHETSATTLVWALYYIHKIPYVKNRLLEELAIFSQTTNDDEFLEKILGNAYLDSLVNESLRIQPPVPFVTRKIINRSFNLGEKDFKIGEEIGVCISLLHKNEEIWKHPAEFNPERFELKKYGPFEFAPFGGGVRKCIGAELAMMELKILIGLFVKNFDSYLIESSLPASEIQQITAGPKKRIQLHFKKN